MWCKLQQNPVDMSREKIRRCWRNYTFITVLKESSVHGFGRTKMSGTDYYAHNLAWCLALVVVLSWHFLGMNSVKKWRTRWESLSFYIQSTPTWKETCIKYPSAVVEKLINYNRYCTCQIVVMVVLHVPDYDKDNLITVNTISWWSKNFMYDCDKWILGASGFNIEGTHWKDAVLYFRK